MSILVELQQTSGILREETHFTIHIVAIDDELQGCKVSVIASNVRLDLMGIGAFHPEARGEHDDVIDVLGSLCDLLGGKQEAVVGVRDPQSMTRGMIENAGGQRWHPHLGVRVEPVLRQPPLLRQRGCFLEHRFVSGERVDVLGQTIASHAGCSDRSSAHHEDGRCQAATLQPLVELPE